MKYHGMLAATGGYSAEFQANGGEEALVLVASSGQGGKTSFGVLTTVVDQGPTLSLFTGDHLVPNDKAVERFTAIILAWLFGSDPVPADVRARVLADVKKWWDVE